MTPAEMAEQVLAQMADLPPLPAEVMAEVARVLTTREAAA